jgi:putative spermidine/putrescine transport system permease protein
MIGLFGSSLNAPDLSLQYFVDAFTDPSFVPVLTRTFTIALQVTLCVAILGYPVAYAMLLAPERWRKVIAVLIVLPIWTSTLVRSYAWIVILGREGVMNQFLLGTGLADEPIQFLYTRAAVLIGLVHVMLPYFVFPLYGVMTRLDLRLVGAARSLGASRTRAFFAVFFPLSLPGVASGCILTFVLAIGFFVTPALLGGLEEITYVMQIERQVNVLLDWNLAAAMSIILLVATMTLIAVFGRAIGFSSGEKQTRPDKVAWFSRVSVFLATRGVRAPKRAAPRARGTAGAAGAGGLGPGLYVYVAAVTFFIIAPIAILFPLSLSDSPYLEFPPPDYSWRWYENFFSRPDWTGPAIMSFKVAVITMIASTALGTLAGIGLSRARFWGATAALGLIMSPTVVPHLIVAVGLYFQLAQLHLVGSTLGIVMGHMILALPLVTIIVLNALKGVDLAPERAARSLGAGPIKAFCETTLVLIRPSIITASFFAFLASFDDVIMAMFLSGTTGATLPKRMWDGIVFEIDPTVAAVATLMICLSVLLFVCAEVVSRKK